MKKLTCPNCKAKFLPVAGKDWEGCCSKSCLQALKPKKGKGRKPDPTARAKKPKVSPKTSAGSSTSNRLRAAPGAAKKDAPAGNGSEGQEPSELSSALKASKRSKPASHKPTEEQQAIIDLAGKLGAGDVLVVEAGAGCLAADTVINVNRGGKGFESTIGRLVKQFNGIAPICYRSDGVVSRSRLWDLSIPTRVARAVGDVIMLGTIKRAWYSGKKQTYTLETASGRSIRATAAHPFLLADGEWKWLEDIEVGDILQVNGGRGKPVGHDKVVSIKPFGVEKTYDIEMVAEPHNFLANGFVVHNTGKTSTMVMLAKQLKGRGQYCAFNKSLVEDSRPKFAGTRCEVNTTHSLAFRAIGKRYAHKLGRNRVRSWDVARILGIEGLTVTVQPNLQANETGPTNRVLDGGFLASLVMGAIRRFQLSADSEVLESHFRYVDGIDRPDEQGCRTYTNNLIVRRFLLPFAAKAWADLEDEDGQLPFAHDCQPPGTLVRRVVKYGGGVSGEGEYEDVPIEQVQEGDRVVSYTLTQRRGYVRRAGRLVMNAGNRPYRGRLVVVKTESGRRSSYTVGHKCIARLDCDLIGGNYVVYLAQRGSQFRVGRTTWRTKSQGNSLGIRRRADSMDIDAIWILGVYDDNSEAALAEATAGHQFNIPTLQFPWRRMNNRNQVTPLNEFWEMVGDNRESAVACLKKFGRDIHYPLFDRKTNWGNTRRPLVVRAINLLSGMLVLDVDSIKPGSKNELRAYEGAGGWVAAKVSRTYYQGPVYNLEVETDHTYVADGIATHNCYVKLWQLGNPTISCDWLLVDEDQDTPEVVASIINKQSCIKVLVGDANQKIYDFRGCINVTDAYPDAPRLWLTQSFRFGQAIADAANSVLASLEQPTPLRLKGLPSIQSRVREIHQPEAVLCRTNAAAVGTVINLLAENRKPFLVGGGNEVRAFVEAAVDLSEGRSTQHPDLACFETWAGVQEYAKGEDGDDLRLLVRLIDSFGADKILDALRRMPDREEDADTVVSTAHKAKGREWDLVQLAPDWPTNDRCGDSERRLIYVAVTRAKVCLDVSLCPFFTGRDCLEILFTEKPPEQGPLPAAPSEPPLPEAFTWARGRRGDWLVRGPAGFADCSVPVVRKDGSSETKRIGRPVWTGDGVSLYPVV